jgi:ubiquitin carboxyl-terminal hydrolase 9/13
MVRIEESRIAFLWKPVLTSLTSSYCNSIIQCLYYSVPFREQVINFPSRTPLEILRNAPSVTPPESDPGAQGAALSPTKSRTLGLSLPSSSATKTKAPTPVATVASPMNKEENKDSPEYKKKMALANGPVIKMDYEYAANYGMKESLFTSLKDIFEAIIAHHSRTGVVSPEKFLEILKRENEMFRAPMHQDAHEFLNLLLNEVVENVEQYAKHVETNGHVAEMSDSDKDSKSDSAITAPPAAAAPTKRVQNASWVHELFEGTLTSETRCLTCENTSSRDEIFLDLSVDLEQHSSVTSCLRKFSEEEMLCERNKFHCDQCGGLQEAEKRMKIKRLPKILALHLKRFKYTEDLQRLQKLFHRVMYPYYLRLFNTTDDAEDPDRLYELYAVVVHIGGGPYHGHYVSIVKTEDRGWLLFDDENVEPVDKSFVRNFFGSEQNLACAYVLFYQETTFEAMQRELDAENRVPTAAAAAAAATASDIPAKEPVPLVKSNGFANGGLNGGPHGGLHGGLNGAVPLSPHGDDNDFAIKLDHAVTAPAAPTSPAADAAHIVPLPPLEHSPTANMIPFLHRKKSNIQDRKEHQREEKEKRAAAKAVKDAEKEAEKAAKAQKKENLALQKRLSKRDTPKEEELPASRSSFSTGSRKSQTLEEMARSVPPAATTSPAAPEERRPLSGGGVGINDVKDARDAKEAKEVKEVKEVKENGTAGLLGNSLHRFRQTSMSLKSAKPKFWSSNKTKNDTSPVIPGAPPAFAAPVPPQNNTPVPNNVPNHVQNHVQNHFQPSALVETPPPSEPDPLTLPPLPPTPAPVNTLRHSLTTPAYVVSPRDQINTPVHTPAPSLTPPFQPTVPRTPTPTALPPIEQKPKDKKEKEKKGFFGIGKKKSVMGLI